MVPEAPLEKLEGMACTLSHRNAHTANKVHSPIHALHWRLFGASGPEQLFSFRLTVLILGIIILGILIYI